MDWAAALCGVRNDQRLVTTGLYRWIRHPGYLSCVISFFGISLVMWLMPLRSTFLPSSWGHYASRVVDLDVLI